ncbi:hypothetical protein FH972_027309 [Carpinus fangiana]|uniref:Tr-type G domain-containing protein n=1 Tax=Carpinus fangiana TaxID=176857 RepID=A0A5N6N7T8_9ROSI|nr:hypothetical protein FH972_027309 [Carpinus fangiana]
MPQTKFVVGKALKLGLRPIVAINKVDRPDARITEVVNEVFDLFAALDANDDQLDFPILYGSGRNGWMADAPDGAQDGMAPLFELVLKHVPEPKVEEGEFRMLGTLLEANPYLGRLITGRVFSGSIKPNQNVKVLDNDGKVVETGRVSKILAFRGIERAPIDVAEAGDIVAIAGLTKFNVADTLCVPEVTESLHAQPIDPPTLSMTFLVNDSPLAGTEGDKVTSRVIRDRLMKEASGERLEPIEEVIVDVDEEHSGVVIQKMSERKADMLEMRPSGGNRLRLVFHAPTRGLIGYQGELMTDTKGTAIMNRLFHSYMPWKGELTGRRNGVLLSNDAGEAVAYAMWNLEDRGPMMIEPGWKVYQGMIIGQHTRENDLEVNVLRGKKLTNIRAAGKDEAVRLTPPIRMTLERALAYIENDELVEVTPKSIRLRKTKLDPNERKRAERSKELVD